MFRVLLFKLNYLQVIGYFVALYCQTYSTKYLLVILLFHVIDKLFSTELILTVIINSNEKEEQ